MRVCPQVQVEHFTVAGKEDDQGTQYAEECCSRDETGGDKDGALVTGVVERLVLAALVDPVVEQSTHDKRGVERQRDEHAEGEGEG